MSTVQRQQTGTAAAAASAGNDRAAIVQGMIAQFRLALRETKCLGSERLHRLGVSMSNLHVMSMLERHGPMTMSRIADALDVSLSNATGLVDRMVERGLVDRVRDDEDRRVVHVALTERAREALSEIEVFQADALTRILDELDERQLDRLVRSLSDLRAAVARVSLAEPDLFAHNHQFHEPPGGRTPSPPKS